MIKRIAAVAMAGAMMVSMSVPAMAEDGTLKIEKHLLKDANAYTPNATYNFTIQPETTQLGATEDGMPITAGISGGVTSNVTITTPEDVVNTGIGAELVKIGTGDIQVNLEAFTAPGIYRYAVTETECNYEGITTDPNGRLLDVYIVYNEQGKLTLGGCVFLDQMGQSEGGKDTGIFINDYQKGANDLKIEKTVVGNQGVSTKDFSFTISVTDEDQAGEKYYVTFSSGKAPITLTSGESKEITLKGGEYATIHGLSKNDVYSVEEDDYSKEGYTTSINEANVRKVTGSISNYFELHVVNTKNATTPTGIVMDIAPYIIMVAAAGVLAFVFLRRRSYTK